MAAQQRKIPNESLALRLFVYGVFVTGTITLILAVAVGSSHWLAPLVAVVVTIWPTILFYLREQERQENLSTVKTANAARSGDFDFDDDDPTQPPRERTR